MYLKAVRRKTDCFFIVKIEFCHKFVFVVFFI